MIRGSSPLLIVQELLLLRDKQEISMEELIILYFDLILAPIWPLFLIIFALNPDEKGSNLPPSVHIVLIGQFSLFLGVNAKKMGNH